MVAAPRVFVALGHSIRARTLFALTSDASGEVPLHSTPYIRPLRYNTQYITDG